MLTSTEANTHSVLQSKEQRVNTRERSKGECNRRVTSTLSTFRAIDKNGKCRPAKTFLLATNLNFSTPYNPTGIPATMSQKRKHEEVADLEAANPITTKKPRSFPHAGKTRHKRPNAAKDKDSEYGASANALKNRIRDLKRLLAHVDNVPKHKMSASSRIERERELEACEHELEEKTMRARESEYRKKMIGKYHQVRFFGRFQCVRRGGDVY